MISLLMVRFWHIVFGNFDLDTGNDEPVRSRPCTINPGKSMEEILNDKEKVASFVAPAYKILEKPCSFGKISFSFLLILVFEA